MTSRSVPQQLHIGTYFSLDIGRKSKPRQYDHAVIVGRISLISVREMDPEARG